MPGNIGAEAHHLDELWWEQHLMLATVVQLSGDTVQIQRNSPGTESKYYARLEGKWSLVAGDVVCCIDMTGKGGWVIFGKIGGDTSP